MLPVVWPVYTGQGPLFASIRRSPSEDRLQLAFERMKGFNKEAVGMFFGQYRKVLVNGGFVPTRIWNCDETGFTTVAKPPKGVCMKGIINQVRKVYNAEHSSVRLSTQANG